MEAAEKAAKAVKNGFMPSLVDVVKEKGPLAGKGSNSHYVYYGKRQEYDYGKYHLVDKAEIYEQFNDVCYARLTGVIYKARVYVNQHKRPCWEGEEDQALIQRWFDYITLRSPFSHIFLNAKDKKKWLEEGLALDCDKGLSYIMAGITALREGWEFPSRLEAWGKLLEKGFSEREAHILSQFLLGAELKWSPCSGGHACYIADCLSFSTFKEFLEDRLHERAANEAPANKERKEYGWRVNALCSPYNEKDSSLRWWFQQKGKVVGGGWDVRTVINVDDDLLNALKEEIRGL